MSEEQAQRPAAATRQILLVENELMIALEIESIIKEAGLCEVHIAGNQAAARELIEEIPSLSAAILDVNLSDGTSLELAEELQARGMPLAFATGYDRSAKFLDGFREAPIISKPFDKTELLSVVSRLLAARAVEEDSV